MSNMRFYFLSAIDLSFVVLIRNVKCVSVMKTLQALFNNVSQYYVAINIIFKSGNYGVD